MFGISGRTRSESPYIINLKTECRTLKIRENPFVRPIFNLVRSPENVQPFPIRRARILLAFRRKTISPIPQEWISYFYAEKYFTAVGDFIGSDSDPYPILLKNIYNLA
ncbi:MAG: hypothetical protein GX802_00830 [Clostridiales bacterium]|jgi:hypothetical protein|nr:hypothetical protein [Clostridiales bacterium]